MLSLYDELKQLTVELTRAGIDYALCGGLAMAVHELPRATVDIDLLISSDSLGEVTEIARQRGFTIIGLPMSFAGGVVEIRTVSKIDPEAGDLVRLDLILVTPQLLDVWDGREQLLWEGDPLWVVSRSGLIALKKLRSSGQDLDDIKNLRGES